LNLIVDTNILVRAVMQDDPVQGRLAGELLRSEQIVISVHSLCEMVRVLHRVYKLSRAELIVSLETLLAIKWVIMDRPVVDAGLSVLRSGGDFADGVIAFEGRRLGGERFATFDNNAAAVLRETGQDCLLLSTG